jgi:fumarate reductase flavoprotein subunit
MDDELASQLAVIGAGAAGMMAALKAAQHGCDVLLLEKNSDQGCNTQFSGGLLAAANTRFQQAHGIVDSPELMMGDILAKNGGEVDRDVLRVICQRSADAVHFMVDHVGLPLHLEPAIIYTDQSAIRMHATPHEKGVELVAALRQAVLRDGRITFADHTPVVELTEHAGGFRLGTSSGESLRAEAVIVACDGFGANDAMISEFCPEIAGAPFMGSANNTGDAMRWARSLGAALDLMNSYQGHSRFNPGFGTHLAGALPSLGSIVVRAWMRPLPDR